MAEENKREIQTRTIQRANGAAHLLEHPVLREALEELRRHNYDLFCSTPNADDDQRRALWAKRNAIDAVEEQLDAFVQMGKIALHEREQEKVESGQEKE